MPGADSALARPTSMNDVKDQIALRIQTSFVELMPEDAWIKLVENEIDEFTRKREGRYLQERRFSNLQSIIRTVLEEKYREMLKVELAKKKYVGYFEAPGEFIDTFIRTNIASIVTSLLGGLGQNLVEQVKRSIQQDAANTY